MAAVPYVGFSNDTLDKQPLAFAGDKVACPRCGERHELKGGKNEKGEMVQTLLVYHCGEKTYLAAVDHRLVMKAKADCSGSL